MSPDHKLPPLSRPFAPAAPQLTSKGRCSACNVQAVVVGGGDLKVCPTCFALLWHRDWSGDERRRKEAAAAAIEATRERAAQQRRERAAAEKPEAPEPKDEPPR